MGQKLMNEKGDSVDFLETFPVKKYRRIETATHYIDRQNDQIEFKASKVRDCFDENKFIAGDLIAETYIRGATKPMAVVNNMKRKEYLESHLEALKLFKEKIFGYNKLTEKQIRDDESNESKKDTLPMPKDQKKL